MLKLKRWREDKGLTLQEVAKAIGVTEVAVSRYESGARMPRPRTMRKIEELTDGEITPNDFISAPRSDGESAAA